MAMTETRRSRLGVDLEILAEHHERTARTLRETIALLRAPWEGYAEVPAAAGHFVGGATKFKLHDPVDCACGAPDCPSPRSAPPVVRDEVHERVKQLGAARPAPPARDLGTMTPDADGLTDQTGRVVLRVLRKLGKHVGPSQVWTGMGDADRVSFGRMNARLQELVAIGLVHKRGRAGGTQYCAASCLPPAQPAPTPAQEPVATPKATAAPSATAPRPEALVRPAGPPTPPSVLEQVTAALLEVLGGLAEPAPVQRLTIPVSSRLRNVRYDGADLLRVIQDLVTGGKVGVRTVGTERRYALRR